MHCLLLGAGTTCIECLKSLIKHNKKVSICLNKNELYSNIANQRENLRTSALDAKETLKDNVVDIAKDISQMLLGETIDKEAIDKSKIEE